MPGPKHGTWVALSNENGVSVYWEEKAPGESDGVFDGAFMVTAVIRDTPRACCEVNPSGCLFAKVCLQEVQHLPLGSCSHCLMAL